MLDWYRSLIALRRAEPWLSDPRLDLVSVAYDAVARWVVVTRGPLRVVVNLADAQQIVPIDAPVVSVLLRSSAPTSVENADTFDMAAESVAIIRV